MKRLLDLLAAIGDRFLSTQLDAHLTRFANDTDDTQETR